MSICLCPELDHSAESTALVAWRQLPLPWGLQISSIWIDFEFTFQSHCFSWNKDWVVWIRQILHEYLPFEESRTCSFHNWCCQEPVFPSTSDYNWLISRSSRAFWKLVFQFVISASQFYRQSRLQLKHSTLCWFVPSWWNFQLVKAGLDCRRSGYWWSLNRCCSIWQVWAPWWLDLASSGCLWWITSPRSMIGSFPESFWAGRTPEFVACHCWCLGSSLLRSQTGIHLGCTSSVFDIRCEDCVFAVFGSVDPVAPSSGSCAKISTGWEACRLFQSSWWTKEWSCSC